MGSTQRQRRSSGNRKRNVRAGNAGQNVTLGWQNGHVPNHAVGGMGLSVQPVRWSAVCGGNGPAVRLKPRERERNRERVNQPTTGRIQNNGETNPNRAFGNGKCTANARGVLCNQSKRGSVQNNNGCKRGECAKVQRQVTGRNPKRQAKRNVTCKRSAMGNANGMNATT